MKHTAALPGLRGGAGWWHETSNTRKFVPQMLVAIINNLLTMDLSMMLAFPTLLVGALYLSKKEDEDGLRLTQEEASWLGSLVYIFQPLGSLVSGVVTEPLGRRRGMIVVNLPMLVGWLMLRFARSVGALYAANAVLGLSIGFMEAPVLCYIGEISEPRLRSFLTATTGLMVQAGYLLVYLLGATMAWRTAATVCATIPVISFIAMLVVPESPLWLLARGRTAEAERALCWLRGWVRPEAVRDELREMAAYAEHTQRLMQQVATAVLGLLATALLMAVVARVGKRRLSLVSVAGCAAACATLGAYAYAVVPAPAAGPAAADRPATWLPLAAFVVLSFCTYLGVGQIPWMYVAEVYPLRSRGLASGVTAAAAYVLYFTAAKTYLQLEEALRLYGVFWLYAAFGVAGFVFLYLRLPETEGKTLEQVEEYFKDAKANKSRAGDAEAHPGESPAAPPPANGDAVYVTHM